MADEPGTLESLASALGMALLPLTEDFDPAALPQLLTELGLDDPPPLGGDPAFVATLAAAVQAVVAIPIDIDTLTAATDAGDAAPIISAAGKLVTDLGTAATKCDQVATDLVTATSTSSNAAEIATFATTMVDRLLGHVIVRYLEKRHAVALSVLNLVGLTEFTPAQYVVSADTTLLVFRRRVYFERIAPLFNDTLTYLQTVYGWGSEGFDAQTLFTRIVDVVIALGFLGDDSTETGDAAAPPTLDLLGLSVGPTTGVHPPGLQASLFHDVPAPITVPVTQLTPNWQVNLVLNGAFGGGLTATLLPPAQFQVTPPAGPLTGGAHLELLGQSPTNGQPFVIFGATGSSRLQATKVDALVGADVAWNGTAATGELDFSLTVTGGQAIIDTSGGDSFLSTLVGPDGLTMNIAFALGWSSERGFYLSGGAALETAFAINATVGPFTIETVHLVLALAGAGASVEVSLDGSGTIGPITASVARLGAMLQLAFQRGNLGPVDLSLGFKPPTGLGIDIDAGPISGGGFISYDPPSGRYAGVLALSLYDISISAIALLDTKLPGGQSGYSFLIIIDVQFNVGIQLGLGFTLNGVGGLCGINRSMMTDAIQSGLRHHTLDAILFAPDPIADAPQIITTLSTIYPPAAGRYVFGPMFEIGWGTPTLVTAEIGVLIEVPSPIVIAILGQLAMLLPDPDAPIVEFHIDVLGVIDFAQQLFSIDATLHDSRIAAFTVSGDMAFRLAWGEPSSFLFSVGGFNPHYQPPPSFPSLQRLTVALHADVAKLTLQAYLAVSSNSFQIGAQVELLMNADAFNVYGWLGFDALIIFSPFSFVVDFTAGLALRSGTSTIMGISVTGTLSGPTPWHADGEAHVSILFFDLSVHVSVTIGSAQSNPLPAVNAWVPLLAAIQAQGNWSGTLPAGAPQVASLVPAEGATAPVLVDPAGVLTFRETVLPLNQPLTQFGEATLASQSEFDLGSLTIGSAAVAYATTTGEFSPGQFEQLSDADKLSLPSFEPMTAGFTAGDSLVAFGKQYDVDIEYETLIVDSVTATRVGVRYPLPLASAVRMARTGAAARGALFTTGIHASNPPAGTAPLVTLSAEQYVIAGVDDLAMRADIAAPATKSAALSALNRHLAVNPGDRGTLQIVPMYELAA
jgi:hypothetical protein